MDNDKDGTEKDLELMWGTVIAVDERSIEVRLGNGETTGTLMCWIRFWNKSADAIRVGTRLRLAVRVKWTASYFIEGVLTAVHEGGTRPLRQAVRRQRKLR